MFHLNALGARLTAAGLALASVAGPVSGAAVLHDPYRYFQHQGGILPTDSAFKGLCYSAAGYNTMLGIVGAGNGTWKLLSGGTEAHANSIAGRYNGATSPAELGDGDLVNETTPWFLPDENFVATYLEAPAGFAYRTVDYSFADLASIDQDQAIGALALVDRVDVPDAELLADEWWLNFHVISLFELDIAAMTARFTDSNIDLTGKEFTNQPGALLREDFTYGVLRGGGQTLSWDASGVTQNADGRNMDGELLASIRVIYMVQVPTPSSPLLVGLGGFFLWLSTRGTCKPLGRVGCVGGGPARA